MALGVTEQALEHDPEKAKVVVLVILAIEPNFH